MFHGWGISLSFCLLALTAILCSDKPACGDIYQWEWIDPDDHSQGKQQSAILCPDGAGVDAVPYGYLDYKDLTQAYLIGATLTGARCWETTLTNADLTQANLYNADLYRATLTGANLTDANVQCAYFYSTSGFTSEQIYSTASYKAKELNGIRLCFINMNGWTFADQNLSNAGFYNSTLVNADLSGANLYGADFYDATLTGANLTDANVQYVDFYNSSGFSLAAEQIYSTASYKEKDLSGIGLSNKYMAGWNFANQNLYNAKLFSSNLTNADLSQANLYNANLNSTRLMGANLTDANVQYANFESAQNLIEYQLHITASYKAKELNGIRLSSINMTGWNFANQNLSNASFDNSTLFNADLSGANLYGAYFYDAMLTSANLTDANVQYANFCYVHYFTSTQLYSTASYKAKELIGIVLSDNVMTGWNFTKQNLSFASLANSNLTNADLSQANLHNANFSNATLTGANLTDANVQFASFSTITSQQLYSTASYKAQALNGLRLSSMDMIGWNFANQNLTNANFSHSNLTNADLSWANLRGVSFYYTILSNADLSQANLANANFYGSNVTGADLSGADTRGAQNLDLSGSITMNTILPDGSIQGLHLSGGRMLVVRDSIPITVQEGMDMGSNGKLQFEFGQDAWGSKIAFDSGISVRLGGTLDLRFAQGVGVLGQIGRKFSVFDWSGVNPTGLFSVSSLYDWDLTRLYASGEVTLDYVLNASDTRWTGAKNAKWNDPANWSAGVPLNGAIIEFDSADPAHLPFVQNIANPLNLEAIMFSPNAGEHILGGPTLQLTGGAPTIVCASINDQYIGNPLELADNTVIVVSGSGDLTLGGEIDGSGNLTKRGSGELILANSAMHEGETLIENGILALDTTGQLENSPITNDAIFQILSGEHTVKAITGGGTTVVDSGSLTVHLIIQDSLTIGTGAKLILAPLTGGSLSGSLTPVPEPATIVLLAMGLVCLLSCSLSVRKQK